MGPHHDLVPPVGVRADTGRIIMTLTPSQAHAIARAISRTAGRHEVWLDDVARSLSTTADHLEPVRPIRRRPLRLAGSALSSLQMHAQPSGAERSPAPMYDAPGQSAPSERRPVRRGAGLAAAVAAFGDAITVGGRSGTAAAQAPESGPVPTDRTESLRGVLDATPASAEAPSAAPVETDARV